MTITYQTEDTSFTMPDIIAYFPFTLRVSPHYEKVSRASEAWFRTYGVHSGRKLDEFYKSNFCLSGAMCFPEADEIHLRNCCDFLLWLWAFDDLTDDGDLQSNISGARRTADAMIGALRQNDVKCDLPVAETLRHFWERASKVASPGCRRRFVNNAENYVNAVVQQVVNRAAGDIPSVNEFVELRRDTSGVRMCMALVEYSLGLDLPDAVLADPVISELGQCANDIISWCNDIYSYSLEQSWGDTQNLLVVAMHEHGTGLQGAVDFVGKMIQQRIDRYCYLKLRVKSWGAETDEEVDQYVGGLESWVIGTIEWSFATERYFGRQNTEVKKTLRVNVLPKEPTAPSFPASLRRKN